LVANRLFAIAVKALVDGGFEVARTPKSDEPRMCFMDQRAQRTSTATKRSQPFIDNLTKYA
jgi:hypothetical protein